MSTVTAYETDRFAWLEQQIRLLKAGALGEVDVVHLIQELESEMGSERRELYLRLDVLLGHLLKWQFQPTGRCNSWRGTICLQRNDIARLFKETPSLRGFLAAELSEAYPEAVECAADETGLGDDPFPVECPYAIEHILNRDFWPD
jgi:hypothetical protein